MERSIKDMTPEERGCNLPAGFMEQVETWKQEYPEEHAKGYRPHFDKNGVMTIKHISEFRGTFKPL